MNYPMTTIYESQMRELTHGIDFVVNLFRYRLLGLTATFVVREFHQIHTLNLYIAACAPHMACYRDRDRGTSLTGKIMTINC